MEIRVESALNPDDVSFWERMFPAEKLLKMRRDNPAVFAAQYQNDVEAMREMALVKQAWVQPYEFASLQRHGLYYQIAIDPGGITEKEENSAMGINILGAQSLQGRDFGNIYVLESFNLHADTWTAAKMVVDLWERYNKCDVVVEEAALQRVFQDIFEKEAKFRNHPWFNVRGIKSSELKDKVTLARGVTHFFTRGQVFMDSKKTPELYNKLEDYPTLGTDDVNALLINLKDLKDHWSKRLERKPSQPHKQVRRHSATGY